MPAIEEEEKINKMLCTAVLNLGGDTFCWLSKLRKIKVIEFLILSY